MNYLFIVDIFFNFTTAYYDENDELIYKRSKIAIRYMTGFFLLDSISSIPFDLIGA
jgi:hypothetical protein